ncbi:MAG: fructosamine kinase family protein [Phormidesmis sp.]
MSSPLNQSLAQSIAGQIGQVTKQPFQVESQRSIGGGCINQAVAIADRQRTFFVKTNRADRLQMFEAERDGLQAMYESQTVRVPQPLCCGRAGDFSYIVTEWLDLGGSCPAAAWQQLGKELAAMHQVTSAEGFGWHRDNTIGSTPQKNGWLKDWSAFWRDRRLGPQFELAYDQGGDFPRRDELMSAIPRLLAGHSPAAALLHGDLWSGNAAVTQAGEPVILDPATYYGDPEADLAMTELFGRLPEGFYQAYQSVSPLEEGYTQRKILYNLYHILNHFNLFGGSYGTQANRMIGQILS